ncbi:MAG: mechanosensitive ion channel family protein [Caldisericia bacterium]|jgi:small conductance mechanosensitive channel|nr:mechanosensitive ion channel family protein [Caldisericia bacterium]
MNFLSKYVEYFLKLILLISIFLLIKIFLNIIKGNLIKFYEKVEIYKKRLTLVKLIFSVLNYFLIFLFIWYLLKIFNIDTTPLLAASGIVGIAIGFAGQTFFKDAISGIFLILENYYSVGDMIEIDNILGTVEEIGIRTTIIRNYEGKLFYIPNGEIRKVIKYGYGDQFLWIDIPISYEVDLDKAKEAILKVGELLLSQNEIIELPQIMGVNQLGESSISILVKMKIDKEKRWSARRKFLEEIKKIFDKEKIEIPYNRLIVYLKDKEK